MTLSRLSICAASSAQTLPSLIDCVAQLGITPRRVRSHEDDGTMMIQIEQDGVPEGKLALLAERMLASVLVKSVQLTSGRG